MKIKYREPSDQEPSSWYVARNTTEELKIFLEYVKLIGAEYYKEDEVEPLHRNLFYFHFPKMLGDGLEGLWIKKGVPELLEIIKEYNKLYDP